MGCSRRARSSVTTMEGVAHGLAGAAGSVAAVSIVFPLEKVSKTMQNEGGDQTTLDCIKAIHAKSGWKGFYQGIESSLVAMTASMYTYFWSHDVIKKTILNITKDEE